MPNPPLSYYTQPTTICFAVLIRWLTTKWLERQVVTSLSLESIIKTKNCSTFYWCELLLPHLPPSIHFGDHKFPTAKRTRSLVQFSFPHKTEDSHLELASSLFIRDLFEHVRCVHVIVTKCLRSSRAYPLSLREKAQPASISGRRPAWLTCNPTPISTSK